MMTLIPVHPAHAADIPPMGIGDLMPSPDTKYPAGHGTLYETYRNPLLWSLDVDYGVSDLFDATVEHVADLFMLLIVVIGSAAVVIVQWTFQLTSVPALEDTVTRSIGGAASGLTTTLLPTALAVGGLVAFIQHRRGGGGGGLGQIAWVGISALVSISLLTTPAAWVGGVDTVRNVGANITMNATSAGIGDGAKDFPFKLNHDPQFTGNGRDDMLRKSSDSVWRAYVAGPWCIAEFGSFEVCRKYGASLLDKGFSPAKRKEWLVHNVTDSAVGDDSVSWRQGHNPIGRVGATAPSLVSVIMFAALVIILAFTSLASLIGALLLLLTGVVFACLWVVPGKPRAWGLAWFDRLLGATLESLIASMTLGAVLSLQAATTTMFGTYGWLPSMGMSIAVAVVGVKFRGVLAQIFGVSTSGGSAIGGFLAAQALSRIGGRMFGGRRGGGRPAPAPGGGNGPARGPAPGPGRGGAGGRAGGGPAAPNPRVPTQRPPAPAPLPAAATPQRTTPTTTIDRLDAEREHTPAPALPPRRQSPLPAIAAGRAPSTVTTTSTGRTLPAGAVPERPALPAPAGSSTTRPALPANGTATSEARPAAEATARPALPPARPNPNPTPAPTPSTPRTATLRPELGDTVPEFAFRQAPQAPPPGAPRVVRGTVVARSAPTPVPTRPTRTRRTSTTTPPPTRRTAPAHRPAAPTPRAGRREETTRAQR
ncbi:hypothetical protein ACFWNL_35905 [Kitasatospora sp. NPDC058397]|uniref:hypothetical protein n=1 Tax=unclassified Kitasatospora TaxID=2633591 RepID=UPI003657B7A1